MTMLECITLDGKIKLGRKQDLILRPAAYAIIVNQGKLLVVRLRHSGKLHLPGGGVHTGERIKDTIKRAKEETGLEIEVGKFAQFDEFFSLLRSYTQSLSWAAFLLHLLPKVSATHRG